MIYELNNHTHQSSGYKETNLTLASFVRKGMKKINRVNEIIAKFLTILKLQPNRATLRSDLTQAVR